MIPGIGKGPVHKHSVYYVLRPQISVYFDNQTNQPEHDMPPV